jgi:hypothetical protein
MTWEVVMATVKMTDYWQSDYSVKSDWTWWRASNGIQHAFIATGYGLVAAEIYSGDSYTRLSFAWNGRLYTRSWARAWGKKTAVRLAREFARHVANGD